MESNHFFAINDIPLQILLADDNEDEHFFFEAALSKLKFNKQVEIVEDGEKLMTLLKGRETLPDVIFLDYNIPRKDGLECLLEIKKHPMLKEIPVIMYSTYLQDEVADRLYNEGAHFFVRKTDSKSLEKILYKVFVLLRETKSARSERKDFIITL